MPISDALRNQSASPKGKVARSLQREFEEFLAAQGANDVSDLSWGPNLLHGVLGGVDAARNMTWEDVKNIPSAMYEGFAQDVRDAGDTRGLYDDAVMREKNVPAGLALAAEAAGAGSVMPAPSGALRMFGGQNAKTVNPDALNIAKRMEAEGASRDEIWKATGEKYGQPWMNDARGGGWKFEIDDSRMASRDLMKTDPDTQKFLDEYDEMSTEFGKGFSHGPVRRAYPYEFNESELIARPYTSEGEYSMGTITTPLSYRIGDTKAFPDKSIGAHEFQHAIQEAENFAVGGRSDEFVAQMAKEKEAIVNEAVKQFRNGEISADEFYAIQEMTPQELSHAKYKRFAGEAEARNVQERLPMNMQQRIETPPWETLDVPEEELIYRFME